MRRLWLPENRRSGAGCKHGLVSAWGPGAFGDPCRECGFAWDLSVEAAAGVVSGAPAAYRDAVGSATGRESASDLRWNVVAYVAHVTDNLRVWGERLASAAGPGEPITLVSYDSHALAAARTYDVLPLSGVLWGLSEAAASWARAWERADPSRAFLHPQRGCIFSGDIARTNAHDVVHHQLDVRRCLAGDST